MAGIKSLAVRGIRSFGPEDKDEQRIAFDKPLTLILGQNGCGKTTIIECLRYAVTGNMPPGSRNECFVHDTKINRTAEVLAQVKLKIVNAKEKQLEISRSMKVTALQKKKSKFQTLDSFLSVIDEAGNVKDISSRCADLDVMVQEELGVSKAIINSVIFCHQEDSSWPLDEGKKVKERFDEIFDADKYSDCFERLRKIRKEYALNIKLLNQTVGHLAEKKADVDRIKLELLNTESKFSEAELKISELSSELKPVTEKLQEIEKLQRNLVAFESKREKIKASLEVCKKQEEELTKAIKTMFEGTTPELQEKISTYGASLKTKKKELTESQHKVFNFNKEEEKMANEMSSNEAKVNRFLLLESQNQERIDKKFGMIASTAEMAELENRTVTSQEEADAVTAAIEEKIAGLNKALDEQKAAADAEENKVQTAINDSRDALSRHKQKILGKEQEINKGKKDMTKVNKEITLAEESKNKLEIMEQKLKAAEEEYETVAATLNPDDCQKEINDDEKEMEQSEQELEQLSTKISNLQKQNTKLKEKDLKEENLRGKEKNFNLLKNKHRTTITGLLGVMPDKDYTVSINKFENELRREVESSKKKMKANQIEMTKLESERDHVRELLKERREELTSAEDKIYKVCGTQSYEATLTKTSNTVEKLNAEHTTLKSSLYLMGRYKEQLSENSCCPLCNRGFEAEAEVNDLISDLATKVLNVPAKLEKVAEELQKASAKKDDLLSLKSLNEKITTLKEKDIPQYETRLADIDKKITEINEKIEELTLTIAEPEQKLQQVKLIHGDMPMLDRFNKEIAAATKEFDKIKDQCVGFETDINLDEATEKQTELRTKISTLRAKIKASRTKLNAHNKKLQVMLDKKNKMKEEMLNVQKKVQEICNLQESLKQLEANQEKYQQELQELQGGIAGLEEQLKEREMEKKVVVSKNRSSIEASRFFITKIESSYEKVKTVEKEIKQHEKLKVHEEMEKIKVANEALMEKKVQIMKDRDTLTKTIDSLKDELAKHEIYKRDLEDNAKLRKAQAEAVACEKEIADIEEKLNGLNRESIAEKEDLIRKQTQLFREKATTEGRLKEIREKLKASKAELNRSQNKNVEATYRAKFHELEVMKTIDKDVRDYSVALEKCLMEFHREKMENINLIIREMWRKIYRGNDIDYIEIKTEGTMTADSERRKYDYRVVQCKNGVEIDMRGRCSAGQKVLACLIIRLALAETFSARFGILALDEPTTNLDQENITSLCAALGEIVQERMKQRNFMFVIITHDKEFIESLGNIDKVTHYYEVSRNEEGKSRIKRLKFT